ncbi:MAG: FAD-binding oxidoreductase [Deltaproteobacteria bacterium]|nr:FAD-binding oxidoreductase [Deltaproteobacteria bacterium]
MANALTTIAEVTTRLEGIVDSSRIYTDPEVLAGYGRDTSLCPDGRPDVAVKVLTTEEVLQVVQLANEHRLPVTPRSSGTGFYGAGIPEQGGIVIDMSGMKKIRRIDKRNKWAMFEAGVTYGELQAELAKHGMRAINPLLPHRDKSVISSKLEREPRLTAKHHLDETINTMEMVLPTGQLLHTGSMSISPRAPEKIAEELPCDLCNFHGPGIDWFRLVPGSQGSFGIVTVMNAKIGFLPTRSKMIFFGFERFEDCVEPFYRMLRKLLGDECFLLNSRALATILAAEPAQIDGLCKVLPAYTIILHLTAGEWHPEEKMAYQEEAVHEIARTFLVKPLSSLPHVPDAEKILSGLLYQPWENGTYWKFRARGASAEIFFLAQLQRAPEFLRTIRETAAGHNYPLEDIGLYLQPKQNGRAFHMEAGFPYDPRSQVELERMELVYNSVSAALVNQGAFFYRPYGTWADLVYSRTGTLHTTLKRIKRTLDPHSICNPGKLGF